MTHPHRVDLLVQAGQLTARNRNKEYGEPIVNLSLAGELKSVFRAGATRELSFAEQEAIDMILTKIARVGTGAPKDDTYVDMAAYSAIAGEVRNLTRPQLHNWGQTKAVVDEGKVEEYVMGEKGETGHPDPTGEPNSEDEPIPEFLRRPKEQ